MIEDVTKVANQTTEMPKPLKTSPTAKPQAPKAAVTEAPKLVRRQSPAAAKARQVTLTPSAKVTGKSPAKRTPRVAQDLVEPASSEAKPAKAKKAKLVRDSFTMPEAEYAAIAALKKRCLKAGMAVKKSEILRAAIAGLARRSDVDVAAAIQRLAAIKTGRPAKAK